MTDVLKRADAFRLGADPTPEDVDKANMLITELSAEVAHLRDDATGPLAKVRQMWEAYAKREAGK